MKAMTIEQQAHFSSMQDAATPAESELLRRWIDSSDREALALLFARLARPLWAVAYRLTNDVHAADDAVQQGFLAAMRGARPRHCARAAAWVIAVVANAARMEKRAAERRRRLTDAIPPQCPPASDPGDEDQGLAWTLLAQLPDHERLALTLHVIDQLTVPEVAAALGRRAGTVHMQIHRALERMRALFGQHGRSLAGAALVGVVQGAVPAAEVPADAVRRWIGATASVTRSPAVVSLKFAALASLFAAAIAIATYALSGPAVENNPPPAPSEMASIPAGATWQQPPRFREDWLDQPVALVLWRNSPNEIVEHIAIALDYPGRLPAALPRSWWHHPRGGPMVTWNADGDRVLPLRQALDEIVAQLGGAWLVRGGRLVMHWPLDAETRGDLFAAIAEDRCDDYDESFIQRAAQDMEALRHLLQAAIADLPSMRRHRKTLNAQFFVQNGVGFDEMLALASAFADDAPLLEQLRRAPVDELVARLCGVLRNPIFNDQLSTIAPRVPADEVDIQACIAIARIGDPMVVGPLLDDFMAKRDFEKYLIGLADSQQPWVVDWLSGTIRTERQTPMMNDPWRRALEALHTMSGPRPGRAFLDLTAAFQPLWKTMTGEQVEMIMREYIRNWNLYRGSDRECARAALSLLNSPDTLPELTSSLAKVVRDGGLGESLAEVERKLEQRGNVQRPVVRSALTPEKWIPDEYRSAAEQWALSLTPEQVVATFIHSDDAARWTTGASVLAHKQSPGTVRAALAELANCGMGSDRGRAIIGQLASSAHPAARARVLAVLYSACDNEGDSIDPGVITAIVRGFQLDLTDEATVELLERLIGEAHDPLVRAATIDGIFWHWKKSDRLLGVLRFAATEDPSDIVRASAIAQWLVATGENVYRNQHEGDESLVRAALADSSSYVRAMALHQLRCGIRQTFALRMWNTYFPGGGANHGYSGGTSRLGPGMNLDVIGSDDAKILELLRDPDPQVRIFAAIFHPGKREHLSAAAAGDESAAVRTTCVHMLGRHLVLSDPAEREKVAAEITALRAAESDAGVLAAYDRVLQLTDVWEIEFDPPRPVGTEQLPIPRLIN
jgi:RNA polymerase sigma-70 factor, ECF subfamily